MEELEKKGDLGDEFTNEECVFFVFLLSIVFDYNIFNYNYNEYFNLHVSFSIYST